MIIAECVGCLLVMALAIGPQPAVVPVPKDWTPAAWEEAFAKASVIGTLISITDPVDWKGVKVSTDAPWQNYLAGRYGLTVFPQMDPYVSRTGPIPGWPAGTSFADAGLRRAYLADVRRRAESYLPRSGRSYFNLAMECQAYAFCHPEDWPHLIRLIRDGRALVRRLRPECRCMASLHYEHLLIKDEWRCVRDVEAVTDVVGISSYPQTPGNPRRFNVGYYDPILKRTRKPIVFAELGWSADDRYGGSEQGQSEFARDFGRWASSCPRVELVVWYFLHDRSGYGEFFDRMGLYRSDGSRRPSADALLAWRKDQR